MFDPYDRSWRRLGLALDIIGFITEDKNRSDGIYYVRFSELELPQQQDEIRRKRNNRQA
jgi:outer membrane protein assembly factor BamC